MIDTSSKQKKESKPKQNSSVVSPGVQLPALRPREPLNYKEPWVPKWQRTSSRSKARKQTEELKVDEDVNSEGIRMGIVEAILGFRYRINEKKKTVLEFNVKWEG
jgi:DNA polymerase II small subunit/DNA polymerase delta subunit B